MTTARAIAIRLRASLRTLLSLFVVGVGINLAAPANAQDSGADAIKRGEIIYRQQCAMCHGAQGEGVADHYDETLQGNLSLAELTERISDTMPEEDPDQCIGDDADAVARYLYETFYTEEARARNIVPRIELVRLTNDQYRNAVADLVGSFVNQPNPGDRPGLAAQYYNSRGFQRDKRVIERIDQRIDFDFGEKSPDAEKIGEEEFAIKWEGSIRVERTGSYRFVVRAANGFKLWINDTETPLIDAWVYSGNGVVEHEATITLLGGRHYPLQLDYFKFKDKSASVQLLWQPPHQELDLVSGESLIPVEFRPTWVCDTPFPADDASSGYERGSLVTRAWDEATTNAAIDTANYVARQLERLARADEDKPDYSDKVQAFLSDFASRAFRRPLDHEQRKLYIESQFTDGGDVREAAKRSVMLILKSPRFLYLGLTSDLNDDYEIASRLSFALWDSLPDQDLRRLAQNGKLSKPDEVRRQARRMLDDVRARTKLNQFFDTWLHLEEGEDIARSEEVYSEFDKRLVADLRRSLELFVDEIIWSENSDYRQLMLAEHMYVNQRIGRLLNVEIPEPSEDELSSFVRMEFEPDQRAGLVTHPYLLTQFSYHETSSPIHRGVFVTRQLLGRTLNPPPMAIEFKDDRFDPHLSMREKVTEMTKSENCMSCHRIINPLGFSLEKYDAVGRYRTREQDKPIDVSVEYPLPSGDKQPMNGARDLANLIVKSEDAYRGFTRHLFHQSVKQPVYAYGPETLNELTARFAANDYNVRELLIEIAMVAAFEAPPTEFASHVEHTRESTSNEENKR